MTSQKAFSVILILIPILMLSLIGCGGGKGDDNRWPTVDVTGFWEGEWESADNHGIFNFLMTQSGNNVEGLNTRLGQLNGTDLYGIVDGNKISGVYTGNNGEVVTFECSRKSSTDFVDVAE